VGGTGGGAPGSFVLARRLATGDNRPWETTVADRGGPSVVSQVQQSNQGLPGNARRRWLLLLGGVLSALLVGCVALWLLRPGVERYDPALIASLQPGMTRQQVEATLGRPLTLHRGQAGLVSSRPDRTVGPGLTMEEGRVLTFDDEGVLRKSEGWAFVRPESFSERCRRWLGF
jgi:hypothetical protein